MKDWQPINDDQTLMGLEGKYKIINGVLYVYVPYTNHLFDCLSDAVIIPALDGSHSGLRPYGYWLAGWIKAMNADKVVLIGCSMGGGIVQIAANKLDNVERVISIGGLNTTFKVHPKLELWMNRGDIVPYLGLWFKRGKKVILNKKWQLPWTAHGSYDIGGIINDTIIKTGGLSYTTK